MEWKILVRFHRKRERNGFMRKRKMYLSVEDIAELFNACFGIFISFMLCSNFGYNE